VFKNSRKLSIQGKFWSNSINIFSASIKFIVNSKKNCLHLTNINSHDLIKQSNYIRYFCKWNKAFWQLTILNITYILNLIYAELNLQIEKKKFPILVMGRYKSFLNRNASFDLLQSNECRASLKLILILNTIYFNIFHLISGIGTINNLRLTLKFFQVFMPMFIVQFQRLFLILAE
jgi:hypothetical protein